MYDNPLEVGPVSLSLFTCSFTEMRPEMGVPVRFTVGAPRFRLKYELRHTFPEGTPTRAMLSMPKPEYRRVYRERLETAGIGPITDRLLGIAREAGDDRLVLLCFEKLVKPGEWCHRTMFAEWWEETIGDRVREIGPGAPDVGPSPASPDVGEQGTLL